MTKNQYNNVIRWTLAQGEGEEDSLTVGKKIFKNLGMPFLKGDYKEVLQTLMSGKYMGWKECTLEQARKCTGQGIPAEAMNLNRVIVIAPNDAEEVVIGEDEKVSMMEAMVMTADEINVEDRMDMQIFAYAVIEEDVTGIETVSVQAAGRTGGSSGLDGKSYSSPRWISEKIGAVIRSSLSANSGELDILEQNRMVIVHNTPSIYNYDDGYEWIKVTYFKTDDGAECTGWIVVDNTATMLYTFMIIFIIGQNRVVGAKMRFMRC